MKYHFKSNVIGTAATMEGRRRKVELEWQFFTMNYISLLTFSYCLIPCFFVVWLDYSAIIWRQQALQTLNRKKFKDGLFSLLSQNSFHFSFHSALKRETCCMSTKNIQIFLPTLLQGTHVGTEEIIFIS